jgi:flagellar biosynthesis regulator FlbT
MFTTYIYEPYVRVGMIPNFPELLGALTLVVGVPLFVMAFIVPVVVLNERSQEKIRRKMGRLAIKLGATVVQKETIKKTTRIVDEGILTEAAGKEIVSTAKTLDLEKKIKLEQQEIVSSQKRIKTRKDSKGKKHKKT